MKPKHFPFAAIVGQDKMKLGLILNVINPTLSGILIRGEKGTSKSTAVRALAEVLPRIEVVRGSGFNRAPGEKALDIPSDSNGDSETELRKVRVVELPVGATEDRVVGTIDLEHALKKGEKRFEPGLLAAAHRGILYVDEVNLLDDHIVDILLDSAAMGVNTVEREGISFSHPARFTLVGTMNPEEGELRPQLLDRFGLCVNITGIPEPEDRVEIMVRRNRFDEDPDGFLEEWKEQSRELAERIDRAREILGKVNVEKKLLYTIAEYCIETGVDGHRGDIITLKTAKTLAAYQGRTEVTEEDVAAAAELTLPHRVRRQPFQEIGEGIKPRQHAESSAGSVEAGSGSRPAW
jgi:magnesium chelatase subunit I